MCTMDAQLMGAPCLRPKGYTPVAKILVLGDGGLPMFVVYDLIGTVEHIRAQGERNKSFCALLH